MTLLYAFLIAAFVAWHALRWARTRPRGGAPTPTWRPPADAPRVSMLVPAWNAADDIPGFVESVRALDWPDLELVLCAGGGDGSYEVARRLAGDGVVVLEQRPGEGKQGALARCFEASSGALIYLTDIDCRLDDDSFLQVVEPIVAGREQVVTGSSIPDRSQWGIGAVLVHWAMVRKVAGREPHYIDGVLGRNCAATRDAIDAIDGFGYSAPTGTDYRMAQQLHAQRIRILHVPTSEVKTEFAWPFASYVRKRARWLRNVLFYAERPRQMGELRGALIVIATPFALLALLLLALLLRDPFPAFLALLFFAHGMLNRLHYVRETLPGRRPPVAGSALNLLATLAAGIYAAYSTADPRLRRQW